MRVAVLGRQDGAVPAVFLELELALVDGQLQPLDGRRHDVRIAETQLQLLLGQAGEIAADGARRSRPLPLLAALHDRVVEALLIFCTALVGQRHDCG